MNNKSSRSSLSCWWLSESADSRGLLLERACVSAAAIVHTHASASHPCLFFLASWRRPRAEIITSNAEFEFHYGCRNVLEQPQNALFSDMTDFFIWWWIGGERQQCWQLSALNCAKNRERKWCVWQKMGGKCVCGVDIISGYIYCTNSTLIYI